MGLSAFDPTVALQQGKGVLAPYLAPSSLSSWNAASQGRLLVRPTGAGASPEMCDSALGGLVLTKSQRPVDGSLVG
jgi:hypothetical protein